MKKFAHLFVTYKKLIGSCVMVLLTGAILITLSISFGWFSQNKQANVDGMKMGISVPPNILITNYNPPSKPNSFNLFIDDLEDYGFTNHADIKATNALYPSSYDGETFRFATSVNPNGTAANVEEGQEKFKEVVGYLKPLYYLEQSFYITTTYTEDVIVALSNVTIKQGTIGGDLYKAIRCELVSSQSIEVTKADYQNPIFRYAANSSDTSGSAKPANGSNSTMTTDPSLICGPQDDTVFRIVLPKHEIVSVEEEGRVQLTAVKFTLRIWIEGQNSFAVVGNAGTGFFVSFDYDYYENKH